MNREETYKTLISFLESYENSSYHPRKLTLISHVINYLKSNFPYMDWVGIYLYDKEKKELYLGPYIGHPGCDLIKLGKGVCGTVALTEETMNVKDVREFKNYIACDSKSLSEIVVPVQDKNHELYGVLDIDSNALASFDKEDEIFLKAIADKIRQI